MSKRKTILEVQAEFPDVLVLKYENNKNIVVRYECGHVVSGVAAGSLRAGQRCGRCSHNAPKGVLERQAEFGDVIVLKAEDRKNMIVKYECSHVAKTTASNLRKGARCGLCCPGGYKTDKPGWLYFMERPGEMQIGITNDPDDRLRRHAREGWELVDMDGPHDGTATLRRESAIKKHLRENSLLIEGTRENWLSSMWSPSSITAIEKAKV